MTITAKTAVATVTELKTQWQKVAACLSRRPVQITHNGKPAGVLISQAAYEDWQSKTTAKNSKRDGLL